MKNLPTLLIPVLIFLAATSSPVSAQPRPEGDLIRLRGQITEFNFQSPASSLTLLVDDASTLNAWIIEAPSAAQLRRLGWTNNSLFTGELVEVQARTLPGLELHAELVSVVRANGAFLLTTTQSRSNQFSFDAVPSGLYSLDKDHAYLQFSYDHLGFSKPLLRFKRFSASLNLNTTAPESSKVLAEIDVASLDSGVSALDSTLRGTEFFDSLNYPRIKFGSRQIEFDAWGHAITTGIVEFKGQKLEMILDVQLNAARLNPISNKHTLGVSVTAKVSRSDWGLTEYLPAVGDDVLIQIEAELVQTAPSR